MEQLITFFLSNFTLSFFLLGSIASALSLATKPRSWPPALVYRILVDYFLLFNVGFSFLYNFVMHVFFSDTAAHFIGWDTSPFQKEVGFASLGFAVCGILSFSQSHAFKCATLLAPALFLWGAAGGHIQQMIAAHNFHPGNAGVIFWTDLLLPLLGFFLLGASSKSNKLL